MRDAYEQSSAAIHSAEPQLPAVVYLAFYFDVKGLLNRCNKQYVDAWYYLTVAVEYTVEKVAVAVYEWILS